MDKLRITKEAKEIIKNGFKSNGCGSDFISMVLCFILQLQFDNKQRALLRICWKYHDAEYSLSRTIKSRTKRLQADSDLQWNIDTVLGNDPKMPDMKRRGWSYNFGSIIHAVLLYKGSKAYWR